MERNGLTSTARLLRELIARPSINPALAVGRDEFAGEHRVADFLVATGRRAGLDVELREVAPRRSNVLAILRPAGKARQRIVLAPHLDTVGGNEIPGELFSPRAHGGRLYGRGACDTKGSVAAMFQTVCDLARNGRRPAATEIVFAGLVGEEVGQEGSRALARGGFRADLAIVGEPTHLEVVTAHKGDLWLKLETRGRAAHGSRPDLGRNAVHAMARAVDALETDYATRLRRRRRHALLGFATINVGSIRGGRQPNIVPDECQIAIDRRTLPGERDTVVTREILAFLRARGVSVRVTAVETNPCPALETPAGLPLVRRLLEAVGQKRPGGVDYFSDAGVLGAAGVPSVLFGPGDIAQAHTADEWISLAQLERGRVLLTRFLQSLP